MNNLVESFSVDHTLMTKVPFLRLSLEKSLDQSQTYLRKYDFRLKVPNSKGCTINNKVLHTFEHIFVTLVRMRCPRTIDIIDISPMGCCTGFYVTITTPYDREHDLSVLSALIYDVFVQIGGFTFNKQFLDETYHFNPKDCGNYRLRSYRGFKKLFKSIDIGNLHANSLIIKELLSSH